MIDHDGIQRLAAMANALRPDWPVKSLATFIGGNLRARTYREAAVALAWVACDPETETPKRMLENGPWWQASRAQAGTVSVIPTRCGEHPAHRAATCPECDAASRGDAQQGAATVRAKLAEAPRYEAYHARVQRLREERAEVSRA